MDNNLDKVSREIHFFASFHVSLQSQALVWCSEWLSPLEPQRMFFLSLGNLSTVKFANMDIWNQLEGLVYQTANADTYSLIKTNRVRQSRASQMATFLCPSWGNEL